MVNAWELEMRGKVQEASFVIILDGEAWTADDQITDSAAGDAVLIGPRTEAIGGYAAPFSQQPFSQQGP
jgi:hypothetical protein